MSETSEELFQAREFTPGHEKISKIILAAVFATWFAVNAAVAAYVEQNTSTQQPQQPHPQLQAQKGSE